jgi:hypothetical protein
VLTRWFVAVGLWGGLSVPTALGDQFRIAWEGDDWPENQGWTRYTRAGGAVRTLENSELTIDSMADWQIVEESLIERPMELAPGEYFRAEWGLRVDDVLWRDDPSLAVAAGPLGAVILSFTESRICSQLESRWIADFSPGVFHDYALMSSDFENYALFIDEQPVYLGRFMAPWPRSGLYWGDMVEGDCSISTWTYMRFGIVPEPGTAALSGLAGLGAVLLLRPNRRGRQMNSKWSLSKGIVPLLCGGWALCLPVGAEVKFLQHTPGYTEGAEGYYRVTWAGQVPSVTILQPWNPALGLYSFECYEKSTNLPAEIGSITADASLEGEVQLEVVPTGDRLYGASDIDQLNFDVEGVTCIVHDVSIQYTLGAAGPTYITSVDDDESALFYARDMESDVEIGEVSATATVHFVYLHGHTLHVAGGAPGFLLVGQ